jgi:hypothetical protein
MYSYIISPRGSSNISHALYTILHGIMRLGSNPRPPLPLPSPPPRRSISTAALVGCTAEPSDPPHRCGQDTAEGPTLTYGRSMAALRVVLIGHHVAMGLPLGLPCLHVVISLAPIWIRSPFRTTGQAPLLPAMPHRCPERECAAAKVGSLGHRVVGAVGPPQHQTTSPPGRSVVGLRPSHPPSPALSSAPLNLLSPSPSAPLPPLPWSARTQLQGAARGPLAYRADGAETPLGTHLAPLCYTSLSLSIFLTDGG